MADEFYYRNTPAVQFPYVQCDLEQLQRLSRNAQGIPSLLKYNQKSVAALGVFQTRRAQNRTGEMYSASVKTTAAARYASVDHTFDLRNILINVFFDLVTYLPLLDIKTLASNTRG